jgi:hypothetical protein
MIVRDLNIFPFKTKFRVINGPFKTGFNVVAQQLKKFSAFFWNQKVDLPCSQEPVINSYPAPDGSSPNPPIMFL